MRFQRILSLLLCAALLLAAVPGTVLTVAAEEKDPMDNFVLHTIHEKKQFDYIAGNGVYGNAWKSDMQIDMSAISALRCDYRHGTAQRNVKNRKQSKPQQRNNNANNARRTQKSGAKSTQHHAAHK